MEIEVLEEEKADILAQIIKKLKDKFIYKKQIKKIDVMKSYIHQKNYFLKNCKLNKMILLKIWNFLFKEEILLKFIILLMNLEILNKKLIKQRK